MNPTDFYCEEDYYAALDERVATPSEACAEYARNAGAMDPGRQWVLTPWDTWERNPAYTGPEQRHPLDWPEDDEIEFVPPDPAQVEAELKEMMDFIP